MADIFTIASRFSAARAKERYGNLSQSDIDKLKTTPSTHPLTGQVKSLSNVTWFNQYVRPLDLDYFKRPLNQQSML